MKEKIKKWFDSISSVRKEMIEVEEDKSFDWKDFQEQHDISLFQIILELEATYYTLKSILEN